MERIEGIKVLRQTKKNLFDRFRDKTVCLCYCLNEENNFNIDFNIYIRHILAGFNKYCGAYFRC